MNHETVEFIQSSINLIQKLRHGVGQVFKDLSDGISENVEDSTTKEETDNSATGTSNKDVSSKEKTQTQKETSSAGGEKSEDQQEKHRALLRTLKKSLVTISDDFSELEKKGNSLEPLRLVANVDYLNQDPVDKNAVVYSQILHAYKWTNKMHETANQAFTILHQNSLKRTQSSFHTANAKKQKLFSNQQVDQFIQAQDQSYPDMNISVVRPLGNSGIVQIDLKHTFKAVIVLRGLMIEYVRVKGYNETFKTEDGQIDIWSSSRYQVFQKITDHAEAASLHFYAPYHPEIAIKSFLLWLQGFSNLFSAPCTKCGKHLQNNMPPTWRDYRSREPVHDVCRM